MRSQGTVERAYELARTGPYVDVDEIRAQLMREHYPSITAHLTGQATSQHIVELCRQRMSVEARKSRR